MSGKRPHLFQSEGKKPNLQLAALRLNRGLGMRDLAELSGVSAETIRLAERGHVPTPRVMFALADFFGVTVLDIWPLRGLEKSSVTA